MRKFLICAAAAVAFAASASAQPGYTPSQANIKAREVFEEERFGIFIHWGIYSMMGDGEWVMNNQNLNYLEYPRLAAGFHPSRFDADEWVKAIKASGARYITITSRHHDGFSMWDSKASDYNIVKASPFKRDVLSELAKACRKNDIKLHFYYSHLDWGRTDYWPQGRTGHNTGRPEGKDGDWRHYMDFINAQLTELLTKYGPIGAIWFDGLWDMDGFPVEKQPEIWNLYEQYALIHKLQPSCLVGNNHHLTPFPGEDIQIFERDIPGKNEYGLSGQEVSHLPLETCQTMNGSWGYDIRDTNYKSSDFLIKYLVQTAGKGANLLLNIGPRPDGTLPDEAVERLHDIGNWMDKHGSTIYGTKGGVVEEQKWGVTTQKDNKLYVHILDYQPVIHLPIASCKVTDAVYFENSEKVEFEQTADGILLKPAKMALVDEIVTLTFDKNLSEATKTEQGQYLTFLYDNMSLPDKTTYSAEFWVGNVAKALEVRDKMGWDIPEREFRHFVLPPRVNNEYLDDFRITYADTLCNRVKGMTIGDAALEINHWCHEQATYRPSDARTSAPMATMRNGLGRCGEESVLTVAALRAAGIPARQIYTPRWAHTDDNHAWVEVYLDGKWYFMGACEPEPVLNMGWFNAPVSRAMLLHTKAFGNYQGDEGVISKTSAYNEINVTENYVPVRLNTVEVVDREGHPVAGATVEFKIYNYAEFYTVARYKTDGKGRASITTGLGDLIVWASKGDRFGLGKASGESTRIILEHKTGDVFGLDIDIVPPAENPIPANPTAEQVRINAERFAAENAIRDSHPHGNDAVLNAFRAAHKDRPDKVEFILKSLSEKDREDVSVDVLEDAFKHCSDAMDRYVDSPRVELEYLYPFFSEIGKGLKFDSPESISGWIQENILINDIDNPQNLRIPPVMVWRSKVADSFSRNIFFVAMCRRFGFPARLDPMTGKVQYRKGDIWYNEYFGGEGDAVVPKGNLNLHYNPVQYFETPEHYSVAKIVDGTPTEYSIGRALSVEMEEGYYMMTSGTRMADGSVLSHVEFFNVKEGQTTDTELIMRMSDEKLTVIGSFDAEPYIPTTGRGYFAFAFLGDKDEPTNHAVRQLNEIASDLNNWGRKLLVYGKEKTKGLSNAVFYDMDQNVLKAVLDGVKSESTQLPVIVVCDTFGRIVYFSQGYNTTLGYDLKRVIKSL